MLLLLLIAIVADIGYVAIVDGVFVPVHVDGVVDVFVVFVLYNGFRIWM